MIKIVVVGFTLTQVRAIGYKSFESENEASAYVYSLLRLGADVISIRRVKV